MWSRLKDLNQNFKEIKEHKKNLRKYQKQYLRCKYLFRSNFTIKYYNSR